MKRTVYNTMIGLMLVCGLAMTSTGAMAQGRRPAATNNAAATGNRSVASAPKNNAATVTNNNNVSSRSTATSVTPQVNRSTTTTGTRSTTGSSSTTVRPSTGNSGSSSRSTGSSSTSTTVRPNTGGNHGTGSTTVINANTGNRSATGIGTSVITTTGDTKKKDNGNVRPNTGDKNKNNGNTGNGNVRPNTGSTTRTNSGHTTAPSSRPDNRPKVKGSVVTGGGHNIDYSTYRYNSSWKPRHDGDRFFNSFRYNSWSWSKPIRPSVRPWRPTTMWIYRPIVTVNVSRYYGYPTIGGVLGLTWGTSFGNALNYLYFNGYYIDGYMDNIVYLTDVELLEYGWDDVMMQFDGNNNLDYVEFVYTSDDYDTSRFFSLYNELCSIYGSPVSFTNNMYSWYGGDGIGFVNLGFERTYDYSYTVLAFGR